MSVLIIILGCILILQYIVLVCCIFMDEFFDTKIKLILFIIPFGMIIFFVLEVIKKFKEL